MKREARFSQNFLVSSELIKKLILKTNIQSSDIVYDIGSGRGVIAAALAPYCHTVVAVEVDQALANGLQEQFRFHPNVLVYQGDFLKMPLPKTAYKVFANIPYNFSADILHKLLDCANSPDSSYLIVQKEFAQKLTTKKVVSNTQLAILIGVRFETKILEEIPAKSFYPKPKVKSVLMEIVRRPSPLISESDMQDFRDFLAYAYNRFQPDLCRNLAPVFSKQEFWRIASNIGFGSDAKPSQLYLGQWIALFAQARSKQSFSKKISGYEKFLAKKHAGRSKIHRTR